MHPPVRWNVLSDGQPDNGTTLLIRMWSGGKNTGDLCSVRSSLWAHAQGQYSCLQSPRHSTETLGACGGQRKLVTQSCLTLCDPMDCSLPGSSVYGILQARVLEWVAISFSSGSSQSRNWTQISCIAGRFFTIWATREAWFDRNASFNPIKFNYVRPIHSVRGFPGRSAGRESACSVENLGSIPGLERSPGEGNGYPPQYSGLRIPWTL